MTKPTRCKYSRVSFRRNFEEATRVTKIPKSVTKTPASAMIASVDQPENAWVAG